MKTDSKKGMARKNLVWYTLLIIGAILLLYIASKALIIRGPT